LQKSNSGNVGHLVNKNNGHKHHHGQCGYIINPPERCDFKKRTVKSEENSDEDEDAFKTVVSTKGQFTSFLQVRNISKIINVTTFI